MSQESEVSLPVTLVVCYWHPEKFIGTARPPGSSRHSKNGVYFSGGDIITGDVEQLRPGSRIRCRLIPDPKYPETKKRAVEIELEPQTPPSEAMNMVVVYWDAERRCGRARSAGQPMGSRNGSFFKADDILTAGEETLKPGSKIRAQLIPDELEPGLMRAVNVEIYHQS